LLQHLINRAPFGKSHLPPPTHQLIRIALTGNSARRRVAWDTGGEAIARTSTVKVLPTASKKSLRWCWNQ